MEREKGSGERVVEGKGGGMKSERKGGRDRKKGRGAR